MIILGKKSQVLKLSEEEKNCLMKKLNGMGITEYGDTVQINEEFFGVCLEKENLAKV
jgi:hypothetical protein